VVPFRGVPQSYLIILCKKYIEADDMQVIHLLHELAVILGVLFQRMNIWKC
jgi:hypothetical protein